MVETQQPSAETKQPSAETKAEVNGTEQVVTLTEDKYRELTGKVASLETSLTGKTAELGEAKKMLDAQAADITSFKTAGEEAVTAYKKLAVSSNPLFSEDVITGSTIAEVDASMARVTDLAGKIKSKVEAEIKAVSVPNGAPERSGPDLSGLSPREKIKQGLEAENK